MSASAARISAPPLSAVQRYFEVSLYLLVLTSVIAVVSTGKLDPFSSVVPVLALAYKGFRLWRGKGPELSVRLATWLVLAYFLFFPFDLWVISRTSRSRRAESGPLLRAALSDSPAAFRSHRALVFGANESRLRLSRRPRVRLNSRFGDSYRRNGLPDFARDFSRAGGLHLRCA